MRCVAGSGVSCRGHFVASKDVTLRSFPYRCCTTARRYVVVVLGAGELRDLRALGLHLAGDCTVLFFQQHCFCLLMSVCVFVCLLCRLSVCCQPSRCFSLQALYRNIRHPLFYCVHTFSSSLGFGSWSWRTSTRPTPTLSAEAARSRRWWRGTECPTVAPAAGLRCGYPRLEPGSRCRVRGATAFALIAWGDTRMVLRSVTGQKLLWGPIWCVVCIVSLVLLLLLSSYFTTASTYQLPSMKSGSIFTLAFWFAAGRPGNCTKWDPNSYEVYLFSVPY